MASSRRTSLAQANRQQEWTQKPNKEVITSNIKHRIVKKTLKKEKGREEENYRKSREDN